MEPTVDAKNDCSDVPCESALKRETPKISLETPIEPYSDTVGKGANRARESNRSVQMACCSERLSISKDVDTYSQRLDDVLLAFFFWLSVIVCLFALAVFMMLGVNVYTVIKTPTPSQRASAVSIAALRETRGPSR
jgi:hypothetical protein